MIFSQKLRAHSRKQCYFIFFTCFFTKHVLSLCYHDLPNTPYDTIRDIIVIRHVLSNYWRCGWCWFNEKRKNINVFHPNGPDFVAIRDIMRVCERAYIRVGSRLAPGVRVSLHPLDQYSVQWRSTVSFSRNHIAILFAFENVILRLLRTPWRWRKRETAHQFYLITDKWDNKRIDRRYILNVVNKPLIKYRDSCLGIFLFISKMKYFYT